MNARETVNTICANIRKLVEQQEILKNKLLIYTRYRRHEITDEIINQEIELKQKLCILKDEEKFLHKEKHKYYAILKKEEEKRKELFLQNSLQLSILFNDEDF
jgi:hypothetical protein